MRKTIMSMFFLLQGVAASAQENAIEKVSQVTAEQINTVKSLLQVVMEYCVKYSFQVIGGIIILVVGWMVAKYVANLVGGFLEKRSLDVTVTKFIVGGVRLSIFAFAAIVALSKFGIEIAPLIAGVSVAGFGLTFALQGPLSNYASGIALIFTKPFKVGEIIEVAGVMGEVIDMKLPRTEIRTVDGNIIVIPNRHIIGEIIHNYSDTKRMDLTVGVSYNADVQKAVDIVKDIIKQDPRVVKEPNVGISEFGDSSVNILARLFCKQSDYYNVLFDINKAIFDGFKAQNIEIPFPQRDVHIISQDKK